MTLSCILVEDEPLAAEKLKLFIERVPSLKLMGSFENAFDGLCFLNSHEVDLLFLDIQMEVMTGIELIENLSCKPHVIITSAYSDYALKGYELNVSDYLLKPYSFDRFLSAVNKVADEVKLKRETAHDVPGAALFIRSEYKLESIPLHDILYIEGMQGYLKIYLPNKKVLTKQSFKNILTMLPPQEFVRVHKSYVVALSKITSVVQNKIKIGEKLIPVGDMYKKDFYESII